MKTLATTRIPENFSKDAKAIYDTVISLKQDDEDLLIIDDYVDRCSKDLDEVTIHKLLHVAWQFTTPRPFDRITPEQLSQLRNFLDEPNGSILNNIRVEYQRNTIDSDGHMSLDFLLYHRSGVWMS
ncbi:hypothetical protein N7478_000675 [Penicillium angulare]|uniref:uncharacterized protein n=1 Tax=Penicillium angulare TaxID=116970 RepID=UPI002540A093|nr:uncharacterized protein N7478_000675 [Penicillium angulare]KAJ5291424.1 hypothetical protein N7478_000675 [Penicillium angulare]